MSGGRVENKAKSISCVRSIIGNIFGGVGDVVIEGIKKIFGVDVGLDTSNFDKNLDSTIVDCQKLADAVDELVLGNSFPAGIENQTLRYNSCNELEANDNLQIFTDRTQNTVPFAICDITENPTDLYPETQFLQKKFNDDVYLGHELVDFATAMRIINAIDYGILMFGDTAHFVYISTNTDTEVVMDITYDGKWNGFKYYKKSISGVENQFNNIVVNSRGDYEKEFKNIGILLTDKLIDSATLIEVPNCSTKPMQTNYYHCEFRIILKRLAGASTVDVFGNSGLQFQFTNGGANEIEILGGLRYEYFYSDGVNDQAVGGAFDCMNFETAPYIIDNADFASNSTDVAECLIVDGSFTFLQATDNNDLKLYIAKVTDAEDYTIEKGSFVKITLKNED